MAFFFHLQLFLQHFFLCLHLHVILSDPVLQLFLHLMKLHLPSQKVTLLVTLLFSKSGMQGSVFQDLFNQHMPTILQFYGHLLLLAIPHAVSIFPRNSAEATSILQYLPEHEVCSLTHLCEVTTAAFQSSLK